MVTSSDGDRNSPRAELISRAEELRQQGRFEDALALYQRALSEVYTSLPSSSLSSLARSGRQAALEKNSGPLWLFDSKSDQARAKPVNLSRDSESRDRAMVAAVSHRAIEYSPVQRRTKRVRRSRTSTSKPPVPPVSRRRKRILKYATGTVVGGAILACFLYFATGCPAI